MRRVGFGLWACLVVVVAVLSLAPGVVVSSIVPSGFPDKVEHGAAYYVLALIPGLLFGDVRRRIGAATAMAALGALLEVLQLLTPGRGVELLDAAANGAGAGLGWITAEVLLWLFG